MLDSIELVGKELKVRLPRFLGGLGTGRELINTQLSKPLLFTFLVFILRRYF